jgi:hypothetical protein
MAFAGVRSAVDYLSFLNYIEHEVHEVQKQDVNMSLLIVLYSLIFI